MKNSQQIFIEYVEEIIVKRIEENGIFFRNAKIPENYFDNKTYTDLMSNDQMKDDDDYIY